MKIKKNDEVVITLGKDRGKRGKIEKILPKKGQVIVGGLNIYKRHLKPRGQGNPGGIIDLIKPLPVSNVALICPKCGKKTRVGYHLEGKEKFRICKKCNQPI